MICLLWSLARKDAVLPSVKRFRKSFLRPNRTNYWERVESLEKRICVGK